MTIFLALCLLYLALYALAWCFSAWAAREDRKPKPEKLILTALGDLEARRPARGQTREELYALRPSERADHRGRL